MQIYDPIKLPVTHQKIWELCEASPTSR